MASLPYYPMYPKDFDTDGLVRAMDDCELGLYIRCLNYSWVNDGLPPEPEDIRRAFRDTAAEFERKWRRVAPCFPVSEDGRRRNPRQEQERAQAAQSHAKRRASGIRSGRARRQKSMKPQELLAEQCSNNFRTRASESDSISVSEDSSKTEKPSSRAREKSPPGFALDEQYAEFRQAYAATGANCIPEDFFGQTWFEWRLLDVDQRAACISGIRAFCASGGDPAFIKSPTRYVQGREWKRPPRPAPMSKADRLIMGL